MLFSFSDSGPGNTPCEMETIKPPGRWMKFDFKEMWQCRELFLFLVWRDLKVRYRQTVLGFSWALLVPFIQMIVFTESLGWDPQSFAQIVAVR